MTALLLSEREKSKKTNKSKSLGKKDIKQTSGNPD
jgi:hypothetical protein